MNQCYFCLEPKPIGAQYKTVTCAHVRRDGTPCNGDWASYTKDEQRDNLTQYLIGMECGES